MRIEVAERSHDLARAWESYFISKGSSKKIKMRILSHWKNPQICNFAENFLHSFQGLGILFNKFDHLIELLFQFLMRFDFQFKAAKIL
jgi:hypothetical protein